MSRPPRSMDLNAADVALMQAHAIVDVLQEAAESLCQSTDGQSLHYTLGVVRGLLTDVREAIWPEQPEADGQPEGPLEQPPGRLS